MQELHKQEEYERLGEFYVVCASIVTTITFFRCMHLALALS